MRLIAIAAFSTALAIAAPLAAQTQSADASVTLEGVADTVVWSTAEGKLVLKPNSGQELWDIALPNSKTLIEKGLSAEVLSRGATVKVRAARTAEPCNPNCKARATELTLPAAGKTVSIAPTPASS